MSIPPIVIIVEPAAMISDVLRVEFSSRGFAVLLAANGEEAEQFAAHTSANLVILDVSAMKLAGYAACARIRHRAGYDAKPIILTVDKALNEDYAAAKLARATALLPKPYSITDLIHAVTPHLSSDDPLLTQPSKPQGMAESPFEWKPAMQPNWRFGTDSGLSRNGSVLSVVRGSGKKVSLISRRPT